MQNWKPESLVAPWQLGVPGDATPLANTRVLVVEDEPLIAMCVEIALREAGAIVFVAMSEEEAFRLLDQVASFDLLITDVNLGLGGCGFAVARAARQHNPASAVIYLSGRSETTVRQEGVARAECLSKPVSDATLIRAAIRIVAPDPLD